ncbi:MAG: nucleotide exchange factor GrpE [Clostridia bacterium]|nr:nucleotide exchange factor GrpE [Clostridia bacterium]
MRDKNLKKEKVVCEEYNVDENINIEEDNVEVISNEPNENKNEYLEMVQRLQADFDNYRRRTSQQLKDAKVEGQISVIEAFLPSLDTFKEAKKIIKDEKVLEGVVMIENKIIRILEELGVEKIDSIGQIYDPNLHNVIAVMKNEEKENDIILDEFQAGYKFNGKVIRYSKVIVNKKED